MNGYFQLQISEHGTELILYPPTDGGMPIDINEVASYLQFKGIKFEITQIYSALKECNEVKRVQINATPGFPENEMFLLTASNDLMTATARFYPPSNGGSLMTREEILNDLKHQNINFGIEQDAIEAFFKNRQYCTDIVLARGREARQGSDAVIEYYFNTDLKARPTLNDDGSVDFFNLNTLNHCKAGDIVARLFKEDAGESGINIMGNPIRPRDVKRANLQFSNNIALSEDRTILTAKVDGHVCLVDGKVFVSNIYQVENVDNSTGNIEYAGTIVVSGNVCSNFSVKADGNVEIRGVVEGAYIEAGGDIIIARGMNGMGRGTLKAGGNVISKFIENATVESGGYVETEAILHSRVLARTEVNVLSKKGFITGGYVSATNKKKKKNLGSSMGADTIVEVGVNPSLKKRFQELQKEAVEINKTLQQIQPITTAAMQKISAGEKLPPDRLKYVQTLAVAAKQKTERLEVVNSELIELQGMLETGAVAQVTVSGEVYGGTKIAIADAALTVKDTVKYCRFYKSQGEVKMTSL